MLRVTHTYGRRAGEVQTIAKSSVRIGRSPDNDVAFDATVDREASGHHAEARFEEGRWWLVDLQSRNGTFVSGQRITRHPLGMGDEVACGQSGPRFRVEFVASPHIPVGAMGGSEAASHGPHLSRAELPLGPGAEPRAAAEERRIGPRTMAMMIQGAVAAATGKPRGSTQEFAAMIDRRVAAATLVHRRMLIGLAVLLAATLSVVIGLLVFGQQSSDEVAQLRKDLGRLAPEDPRRKAIEDRLGALHPSNANFGRTLYDRTKKGVFMLAVQGQGFCTAFAIRPNVLATNAHCVVAARRYEAKGGTIVAVENESPSSAPMRITEMRPHPGYRDQDASQITPDLAVITIAGRAAQVLELASAAELAAMGAGDDVYVIGFPGRLMDAKNPAATFLAAHIGRVTTATGRPGNSTETWLVQHDAPTTHGTSGSPIFNGRGKVVAVNAGGYLEGDDETISGRRTEVVKASPYKFGMRVDLLAPLVR